LNETFLITGAHGFIGAWVVKRLLADSVSVVAFDSSPDDRRLRQIMDEDELRSIKVIIGDITEPDALVSIIKDFGVTNVIHLAGLQVPTCRANPRLGAMVNVIGTINVFEAVRQSAGQINKVVYASSAAVFGMIEEDRALREDDAAHPSTHYGAFKRCNEDNAYVYYLDNGINSVGLRPLTVYGVGRDFGLTSDPTKAMKAAVIGRPYHIRFGGRTDFQYVGDVADTFIRASRSNLTGAHVFNLHGECVRITDIIAEIESVLPQSKSTITCASEPLSIPPEMDDSAIQSSLGKLAVTQLSIGVRATIERFVELYQAGRLDTSDLDQ